MAFGSMRSLQSAIAAHGCPKATRYSVNKLLGGMPMSSIREHHIVSCAAFVAATLAATAAQAQDKAADAPVVLKEIVVTAMKHKENINSVGLTVQAATGNTLQDIGVEGPKNLGKLVPGFTYTQSMYSTPVYTLRGVGLYDTTWVGVPAVAVYTDEIPRDFAVMSDALDLDINRVEVIPGPQGTVFGQSSTGGAIDYILNKPTPQFESGVDLSYERFDRQSTSGFISGPITDTLRARLAVKSVEGGAWQYSYSRPRDELGNKRLLEGRLTLDWTPADRFSAETTFTAVRDRSDPQAPQFGGSLYNVYSASALAAADANQATRNPYGVVNNALYAALTSPGSPAYDSTYLANQTTLVTRMNDTNPENAAAATGAQALLGTPLMYGNARVAEWTPGRLGPADNSYFQGTIDLKYEITDELTLTSLSAFAHQKLDYAQDLSGTVAEAPNVPLFGDINVFNQELRLNGAMRRINWIAGLDFEKADSDQNNDFELSDYSGNQPFGSALPPISFTANDFSETLKSYAAFANSEYKITDHLSATAGVRYTQNDERAKYCYNDPASDSIQGTALTFDALQDAFSGQVLPPILPGQCFPIGAGNLGTTFGKSTLIPVTGTLDQSNTSWRGGLDYKFGQGTLLYATVSQGFKAGEFSDIGASSTSQYVPAKQEKLLAYEAGVKAPLFERRVQWDSAAFYYDYTDKQLNANIQDSIYGLLTEMINIPKSYVWGLQTEFLAEPLPGLRLSLNGTYLRSAVSGDFSETTSGEAVYNAEGYTGNFKASELPYTPRWTANGDAEYEWNSRGTWDPFAGANVLFQGRENATFQNAVLKAPDFEIGSYATLDVRAGLRSTDDKWQVEVYGRNVLNRYYLTTITSYLDTRIHFTGMPAVYGVDIRINFD